MEEEKKTQRKGWDWSGYDSLFGGTIIRVMLESSQREEETKNFQGRSERKIGDRLGDSTGF